MSSTAGEVEVDLSLSSMSAWFVQTASSRREAMLKVPADWSSWRRTSGAPVRFASSSRNMILSARELEQWTSRSSERKAARERKGASERKGAREALNALVGARFASAAMRVARLCA